jgi:hypothetical protein
MACAIAKLMQSMMQPNRTGVAGILVYADKTQQNFLVMQPKGRSLTVSLPTTPIGHCGSVFSRTLLGVRSEQQQRQQQQQQQQQQQGALHELRLGGPKSKRAGMAQEGRISLPLT